MLGMRLTTDFCDPAHMRSLSPNRISKMTNSETNDGRPPNEEQGRPAWSGWRFRTYLPRPRLQAPDLGSINTASNTYNLGDNAKRDWRDAIICCQHTKCVVAADRRDRCLGLSTSFPDLVLVNDI